MSSDISVNLDAPAGYAAPATAATAESRATERVDFITYFRAVAILVIVAGHTYALAWEHFADENPLTSISAWNAIAAVITGGTAFFVFISGFLYRQVFFGRGSYADFMGKKVLYVGLPYLLIATPMAMLEIGFGEFTVTVAKEGHLYAESLFVDFIVLMTTGRMVTAYWYIPFIFLVFVASPLFDRFVRLPARLQFAVFALAVGTALWIHRPLDNLNPVQSFFFFTQYYLFGIMFCIHREKVMVALGRPPILALLALLLCIIALSQALILQHVDNLERSGGWLPLGFDLMLVQKYVAILLLCGLLARWGEHLHRPLVVLADYSFGIFFLHGIVIAAFNRLPAPLAPHTGNPWADLAIYTCAVVAACLLVAAAVKQVLGKRSRYVIGC
jgi:peptidoglycan/LPS O-acetylase OafA/YrhL